MWCTPKVQLNRIEAEQAKIHQRFEELASFVRVHLKLVVDLEEKMVNMDELRAEVARNGDAVKSAVALMQGLFAAYSDALKMAEQGADDSEVVAAVAEITAKMKAQTDELAEAIVQNTPSENAPVAPEEPAAPEAPVEVPAEPAPEVVAEPAEAPVA